MPDITCINYRYIFQLVFSTNPLANITCTMFAFIKQQHILSVSMKSFSSGWLFKTAVSVVYGCTRTSSCSFLLLGLTTSSCMVCNSAARVSPHSSSSLGVAVVEAGFFFFFPFFLGVPLPFVSFDMRLALLPVTS